MLDAALQPYNMRMELIQVRLAAFEWPLMDGVSALGARGDLNIVVAVLTGKIDSKFLLERDVYLLPV